MLLIAAERFKNCQGFCRAFTLHFRPRTKDVARKTKARILEAADMATKLIIVFLALATIAAAAPRSRNYFADYLFRRGSGGCSQEELDGLAAAGVDLALSSIACDENTNSKTQIDEEKRGCTIDYGATPACCSPDCDWIMELHCMSPVQMICKKK